MRRVVITGLGIVSSIGNSVGEVLDALQSGRCGMIYMPEMEQLGYRCCVYAPVDPPDTSGIPRKTLRDLSTAAIYALLAARQAVADAGLEEGDLVSAHAGAIVGTGAGGISQVGTLEHAGRTGHTADPAGIVKVMNCCAAAAVATHFGLRGRTSSLSAACATGLYNIGHAYELLARGIGDLHVIITGSADEDTWKWVGLSADNSNGMPVTYNDRPCEACRPYDRDRQGLVMSAGAGMLVLETLEHAHRRGAHIYAEIVGYSAANDGTDLFLPTGDAMCRSLRSALRQAANAGVKNIDYVNPHGAGTPGGDVVEAKVLAKVLGNKSLVASTKSISGHAQGGAAAQEAVFMTAMLQHNFIAPTLNLVNIDPACAGIRHVQTLAEQPLQTALTLNNGLGGVNAAMVVRKL